MNTNICPESAARYATPHDVLAAHRWHNGMWASGRPGWTWRCTCGINDSGTGAENPERFKHYESHELAALAATQHIVQALQDAGWVAGPAAA